MGDAGSGQRSPAGATKYKGKAIGLAVAAAVGGFLFGFDSSVINGAVDAVEGTFELSGVVTGFVVAVALLGSALGAWLGGRLSDRWGRTRVMVLGAVLFFVSSVLSAFAFSAWDLAIWRVVAGIGIGIASVIAPAYIAEIAPASLRGRLGSLQQLAITLGIFAALLSDQLLATAAGGASQELWFGLAAWRWMFLVCVVPAAVYGILALRIPESPRYLVAQGHREEAKAVLADVLGADEDPEERVAQIETTIRTDQELANQASLRGPVLGLLPVVWVGILLSVFQQFVGINVIFYYSTTLWQAVGFEESQSFLISTFTAVTNVLVTFIAIGLIDKVGRRPLLLIGSLGMTVALGTMAFAFTKATGTGDAISLEGSWGVIALVAANAFVVFFGATWGPLVWVLLGEMFPNRIRAAALGVAASAQWVANFLITLSFPEMLDRFGASIPYAMYASFALISFFFVLTKVPETKGVQLEDMEGLKVQRRGRPASA
ncbi:sugar porter family MFS transporter [Cellulomonas sp. zg-ZUI222]|uniref:Sugar porter family MFS transporter n=1 Tax=Cellulomonas wangleii TaxID=2816956 RepID=A0ABX8D788_9CELL|nr:MULTISPECIES: sugar porter family MFS transporter [Cellulomonas]MBO0899463.1 sugar porter family MFS transporter [Cellulomonas sp. zg-ZUI22]MBO0920314.1 sugar porter family MFS transporter [Cellulomonas wangleii]MBO0923254.1 sugar porter family MFS transporter [Cellulomonas wangleii]QVI61617.1 sugar porter family MFS transporter [Cellulomonas wangleii]